MCVFFAVCGMAVWKWPCLACVMSNLYLIGHEERWGLLLTQLQCCMQACACLYVCPCKDVRSLPAASLASKSSENKVPAKTVTWSNPTASRAGAMIHVCVDVCAYEVEREGNKVFMSVLDIKYICIVLIIDVLAIWFCFVWYLTVCVYFGAVSRF